MIISDIWEAVKGVTGVCDEQTNYDYIRRAVQLLANQGLFDPLIGYADFSVDGSYFVALPRLVKTPLKLTINGNPSFRRDRYFEFTQNTNGVVEGKEVGWSWSDRLYSPIQNELPLPGHIACVVSNDDDANKSVKITGKGEDGTRIVETITTSILGGDDPISHTSNAFFSIDAVLREPTIGYVILITNEAIDVDETTTYLAQYDAEDRTPLFRVIKLSQRNVNVKMVFRKEVLKFTSQDDIVPLDSEMAVIHACNAVKLFGNSEYAEGQAALTLAIGFVKDEQSSRDAADTIAASSELAGVTDTGINSRDSIIVADIYDPASEIFGPIGRPRLFDRITTVIEMLANKAHWDASVGQVDLYPPDRTQVINYTDKGDGYYVLPRFVETVLALKWCGENSSPRNRWFEFNLNAWKSMPTAQSCHWEDAGETVTCARLSIDPVTRQVRPASLVAVPNNSVDNGADITIYGKEMKDGQIVEVIRGGALGWKVPCVFGSLAAGTNPPLFVQIDRITKPVTNDYVQLFSLTDAGDQDVMLGYWYPDEVEPRYKAIKLDTAKTGRLTIRYRRRFTKITSFYEPISLRSRIAIVEMMRCLELLRTDPSSAVIHEAMAIKYMAEARLNEFPSDTPEIQFEPGSMPGSFGNIT